MSLRHRSLHERGSMASLPFCDVGGSPHATLTAGKSHRQRAPARGAAPPRPPHPRFGKRLIMGCRPNIMSSEEESGSSEQSERPSSRRWSKGRSSRHRNTRRSRSRSWSRSQGKKNKRHVRQPRSRSRSKGKKPKRRGKKTRSRSHTRSHSYSRSRSEKPDRKRKKKKTKAVTPGEPAPLQRIVFGGGLKVRTPFVIAIHLLGSG